MRGVRVLVGVQLGGPVVEVHRLHGARAVRVSVHGARDAHPVHPVVGQVFVLHTTRTVSTHAREGQRLNFSGYYFQSKRIFMTLVELFGFYLKSFMRKNVKQTLFLQFHFLRRKKCKL